MTTAGKWPTKQNNDTRQQLNVSTKHGRLTSKHHRSYTGKVVFPLQMLSQDEGAVACPKPVIVMVVMEPSCVVKQHDSAR